jgi:outer membrane protein
MKKVLVLIAVAFAVITVQAQKVGHINSQELLSIMPGVDSITMKLENHKKTLETQLMTMQQEYQAKMAEYEQNMNTWSDLIRQSKEQSIVDLEKRIQEFAQIAQQDLANKEQELSAPLLKTAQDAIDAVAKANGYTYVLDTSSGIVLVFPDGDDLLPLVKKHLGIL